MAGLRGVWLRGALGMIAGAALGAGIFHASQLTGRNLFLICGAIAGAIAAVVFYTANQTVKLTEITVAVPQLGEVRFAVTKDSQEVAWKLFIETVTRITSQPLDSGAGLLREALTSLYSIFSATREILKAAQPSRLSGPDPTVEHLAISMLNKELRPFLTKWHPRLRSWEQSQPEAPETDWPDNAQCRAELAEMQRRLVVYILGFGRLAQLPHAPELVAGVLADEETAHSLPAQSHR